jgi:hypothetical protein
MSIGNPRLETTEPERSIMARKRGSAPEESQPPKRMGRPPSPEGARAIALTIRARPEWKEWLGRFAQHCRAEMAEVVDDALETYAKTKGFEPPPKR